ncbi:hypothetical protein [Ekhidna sp.]|uniref:hypothetical protein n=1 Tax=Ekhidna sp. TaxID=2608089 RepID=UPI0032991CBB
MNMLLITLLLSLTQSPTTIVKKNGDQIVLTDVMIYQTEEMGSPNSINYSIRGKKEKISVDKVKRISFKETIGKKKGITTYRIILVKNNNDKLEVEMNLVKIEGKDKEGKTASMSLSSIDKISF